MKNISFLLKYTKGSKFLLFLLLLFTSITIILTLINPIVTSKFIDEAGHAGPGSTLLKIAVLYVLVSLTSSIFYILSRYFGEKVAWVATNNMRTGLVSHCLDLSMSYFDENNSTELLERVDGDISKIFNLYALSIPILLGNTILLFGMVIVMMFESLYLGIGMLIFICISMNILWKTKENNEGKWIKASEANAKVSGELGEYIVSREDMIPLGKGNYIFNKFSKRLENIYPVIRDAKLTWSTLWTVSLVIFSSGTIIGLLGASILYFNDMVTLGTVFLVFSYIQTIKQPMEEMRIQLQELQLSSASVSRVLSLFEEKDIKKFGDKKLEDFKDICIQFNRVSFQYQKQQPFVLKNLSLTINQGDKLAIMGPTGSGKSTIARLLTRLNTVTNGEILYNGLPIEELSEDTLLKNISYITQDVHQFSTSLRNNITLFDKKIKDDEIFSLINDLGVSDWFSKLENGLDTEFGKGKYNPSLGELQIIALLRTFFSKSKIVILDEATAKLDKKIESTLNQAIDKLFSDRTIIVIAHRKEIIKEVDRLFLVNDGTITEKVIDKK